MLIPNIIHYFDQDERPALGDRALCGHPFSQLGPDDYFDGPSSQCPACGLIEMKNRLKSIRAGLGDPAFTPVTPMPSYLEDDDPLIPAAVMLRNIQQLVGAGLS